MTKELTAATYDEDLYLLPTPITVVLHQPWSTVTSEERVLLGKILASIRQSLRSVRIVHAAELETSQWPSHGKVICFGVNIKPAIENYSLTAIGTTSLLSADALGLLDDVKKKNLWTALKRMV